MNQDTQWAAEAGAAADTAQEKPSPMPGPFLIGRDLPVSRIGFGALHTVGRGGWGDPGDEAAMLTLLEALPELGVSLIDTADSYGPHISERLIRSALHPYDAVVVATKGGLVRPDPGRWSPLGRPEYLQHAAQMSRYRLGVETIDLWQLHRIDRRVPRDEQFDAVRELREEGVIRHVGLVDCQREDIEVARRFFPVSAVQAVYNLVNRRNEPLLDYCAAEGIAFLPWNPLTTGARTRAALAEVAAEVGAAPVQVVLAWLLQRSPVMLPIPGTSKLSHLRENAAALYLRLSDEQFRRLDAAGRQEWQQEMDEEEGALF